MSRRLFYCSLAVQIILWAWVLWYAYQVLVERGEISR